MEDKITFKQWLKKHGTHLRSYTPDEVARIALTVGFSIEEICPGVCDQVTHMKRLLTFWENPLSGKWLKVANYDYGNDDWEDAA